MFDFTLQVKINHMIELQRHVYILELYTVKKAQCNFQLENHVTFHVIGIKIVYNVKIISISADVNLNSIEFTRFYIVHNVI
jgi:hypothetical protein